MSYIIIIIKITDKYFFERVGGCVSNFEELSNNIDYSIDETYPEYI